MDTHPKCSFKLFFAGTPVGVIHDAFQSDGTWYGRFERQPHSKQAAGDYINACEDWNEALRRGDELGDLKELFPEIFEPQQWWVEGGGGRLCVEEAPAFFTGGDVSWIVVPDSERPPTPRG